MAFPTKICADCGLDKEHSFRSKKSRKLNTYCRDCHARHNRDRRRRHRVDALKVYSNGEPHCSCCGETNIEFLCFDHIDGGGGKHRKSGGGVINIGTWLKNQNFPPGFRVLCHNCNSSLGHYGYCPHTEKKGRFEESEFVRRSMKSELYCIHGHKMFGDALNFVGKKRRRRSCRVCTRAASKRRREKIKLNSSKPA